jgi:hypothetical protein
MFVFDLSPSVRGKNRSKKAEAMVDDGMTQAGSALGDE